MKIDGSSVRTGMVIEYKSKLWQVTRHNIVAPGNWRAFNQVELKDIKTGSKSNERLSSDEKVDRVRLDEKPYQYLYAEGDTLHFMDNETYEQLASNRNMVGEQAVFLKEGMQVTIESYESEIIHIAVPDKVEMQVVETEPTVKGQTASSSYKPALLENGVKTKVPPFIEVGERVIINTEDFSYIERAK